MMNKLEKSVALLSLICITNVDAMYNIEDVKNLRDDMAFCQILTVEDAFVHNLNVSTFSSHIFDLFFDVNCVRKLNSNDMAIIDIKDSQSQLLGYLKVPVDFTASQTIDFPLIGYFKDSEDLLHSYGVSQKIDASGKSIVVFHETALERSDNASNRRVERNRRRQMALEQQNRDNEQRVTGHFEQLAREGAADFGENLVNAGTSLLNGNFSGALSSLASSAAGAWNAISNGLTYCFRRLSDLCRRNAR